MYEITNTQLARLQTQPHTRSGRETTSRLSERCITRNSLLLSAQYLKDITKFDNVLDNLITEVVPSKERLFPLVDFVDTPGLTDGGLIYPVRCAQEPTNDSCNFGSHLTVQLFTACAQINIRDIGDIRIKNALQQFFKLMRIM